MKNTKNTKNLFVGPKSKPFVWLFELIYKIFPKSNKAPFTFKKLLICNWGSHGDLLLTLSVLSPLKKAYPSLKIGFLVSPMTKHLLEDIQHIDWIHVLDSWKNKRNGQPLWKRIFLYLKQARLMKKEIRQHDYDTAIDFYPFFYNTHHLLWRARIPHRVGFITAGFTSLLTKQIAWKEECYLPYLYAHLLSQLNISSLPLHYALPLEDPLLLEDKNYIVLHVGSGEKIKEWEEQNWRALLNELLVYKYKLVFTGFGKRENEIIQRIIKNQDCMNCCNQLTVKELYTVVKKAKLVITVDTFVSHIAGIFETPCLILFLATSHPSLWKPIHQTCQALTKKKIYPEEVSQKIKAMLYQG